MLINKGNYANKKLHNFILKIENMKVIYEIKL